MPFIRCVFSGDPAAKLRIMASLSKAIAVSMGKSEAVVMCHVEHSSSLMFGGSVDPASMIQVESIGCDLATIIPSLTEVSNNPPPCFLVTMKQISQSNCCVTKCHDIS